MAFHHIASGEKVEQTNEKDVKVVLGANASSSSLTNDLPAPPHHPPGWQFLPFPSASSPGWISDVVCSWFVVVCLQTAGGGNPVSSLQKKSNVFPRSVKVDSIKSERHRGTCSDYVIIIYSIFFMSFIFVHSILNVSKKIHQWKQRKRKNTQKRGSKSRTRTFK